MPISFRSVLSVLWHPQEQGRSSFGAREAEFHDRGRRCEISRRKREIKYGTLSYSICLRCPRDTPRHRSRHYLPLTSFSGVSLLSTVDNGLLLPCSLSLPPAASSLLLIVKSEMRIGTEGDPAKFSEKEASESIFRVNQAPPTPDISSLGFWEKREEETRDSEASDERTKMSSGAKVDGWLRGLRVWNSRISTYIWRNVKLAFKRDNKLREKPTFCWPIEFNRRQTITGDRQTRRFNPNMVRNLKLL